MKEQKNTTRETIIRKGAELIHLRGYHSTGLQEILTSAEIPKGSFYFYFKSKEDFGLAVIDYFTEIIGGFFDKFLKDESVPPFKRFENLIIFYENLFKKTNFKLGCPIGNLSLELADENEKFRKKLKLSIGVLTGVIESFLNNARQHGDISEELNVDKTAQFIFHGFEGAVLHMKVLKSIEPLIVFKKYIINYLKKSSAQKRKKKGV
jgi:TetR/AcrR family transcriptional repressor of nem operon